VMVCVGAGVDVAVGLEVGKGAGVRDAAGMLQPTNITAMKTNRKRNRKNNLLCIRFSQKTIIAPASAVGYE
jgi:hypothetical protein